jgi:hypothetical protein
MSQEKLPRFLAETSHWFAFAGQHVYLYPLLPEIAFKGKRVLDVLADGDLGLIGLAQGIDRYVAFDVSNYALAFYELKIAAIKVLSREEFIDFFIPDELRTLHHGFDFEEKTVRQCFASRAELITVRDRYFKEFTAFDGSIRYKFNADELLKDGSVPEIKETMVKDFVKEHTTEKFSKLFNASFYAYDYPAPIVSPQRTAKQFAWDTYLKLREHIVAKSRAMLDPVMFNSYQDEKGALQPYARLVTIEEITKARIDIIRYLSDAALYEQIQNKLRTHGFNYRLIQGLDEVVLDSLTGESFDLVSFANVPTYKQNDIERLKLFEKVKMILNKKGFFIFHVNNPFGRTADNDTRASAFRNLPANGFKLIKAIEPDEVMDGIKRLYGKDHGDPNKPYHVIFIYQRIE